MLHTPRDGAQPPLWERGCAPTRNILIKIDIDAQRQRAVGWSNWMTLRCLQFMRGKRRSRTELDLHFHKISFLAWVSMSMSQKRMTLPSPVLTAKCVGEITR